jgi:hypothetical protein
VGASGGAAEGARGGLGRFSNVLVVIVGIEVDFGRSCDVFLGCDAEAWEEEAVVGRGFFWWKSMLSHSLSAASKFKGVVMGFSTASVGF